MMRSFQSTRTWPSLVGLVVLAVAAGTAQAETLILPLGEARTVKLKLPANTAVVGDVDIADAKIAFGDTVVLVGKEQGTTNLIVYDDSGSEIHSSTIKVVSASNKSVVAFITGSKRTIFDCVPALCVQRSEADSVSVSEAETETGEVSSRTGSEID